ncbi:glycosyltransferase [Shewanella sp. 1_MG-2023]|uniref:glycosyltransferase family 2 protein n=1 Tax=unclassified Shewanella TaxID=196818 RepID=UPI0026E3A23A|nr:MULTISPECIES: glycosyltransferase [unclassified Shewanella]MDO6610117.1 glycosyltransferase [Shewanella sp. 7_MG-2023]MDO6769741.1 glycosyltransferase [Shewanella sp. 2_MG-2023]MDO6792805.1 glycosyltransferase [Shewanella sp. 1_MG-2023]
MTKKNSKVSIIMPTYNVGNIVQETIESVLSQTYKDWELIIVDDASTDNTVNILINICATDPRIILVLSEVNKGAGASRNIGLDTAKGRFIAFLDSDDIWESTKLETQIDYMISIRAPICHTSFSFINELGDKRPGRVKANKIVDLEHNLKHTEIGTSTAMIDLDLVKHRVRFSHIRARQDLKLWIELLGCGYLSHGIDIPLVKYRVRNGSVSSNKIKMLWVTFQVYMSVTSISVPKRLFCYSSYVFNAIKKRGES